MQNPLLGRPLVTSVVFVSTGVMPLYLASAQIISLDAELGFDAARLGIGTTLYFGLAAAAAQPTARVVASIGAQRGLQVGAVLSMCGSVAAATAQTWIAILIAVGCAGLSNAFMQVSANIVLAMDAAFHRQGMSFGAKQGAVPLASATAGLLLPSVGVALGWRWPFVFAIGLAGALCLIAPNVDDRDTPTAQDEADRQAPLSLSLKLLAVGGACGGAAGNALSLFLVPAAVDVGTSEATAGTILALGSAMVFVLRVGIGAFADRIQSTGHLEMVVILLVGSVASFCLTLVASPGAFTVIMPVALLGAWGWPGLVYYTVVRIHPRQTARASGVILSSNLTGTMLGPLVMSQLADRGDFSRGWIFVSGLALVSAIFIAASWRCVPAAITSGD